MYALRRNRSDASFLRKVGFTLAEILIALALIAVLAAVLLPAVAGQISKGDTGRTMQDLDALRAGIDQFLADVHRYPKKVSQLTTKVTGSDRDVNGTLYPAPLAAKWTGPYISKLLNDATPPVIPTGFGAGIQDSLVKITNTNGVDYVAVRIYPLDSAAFAKLDLEIDGVSTTWANAQAQGLVRRGTGDTVKYLATPIQ
jgi:prepilin-type N-terminal cleavage/methylation domain-containing protein